MNWTNSVENFPSGTGRIFTTLFIASGADTQTHTHVVDRIDFIETRRAPACGRRVPGLKIRMNDHQNFTCKQNGLVVSASHPYIGASPDGIINCDCCGLGILEAKCPYCMRKEDPSTASYWQNDTLDCSHQYYYQVQTQLFACCSS